MSNALYPTLAGLTWNTTKSPLFNTIIQRSVNFTELRGSFTSTPIYDIVLAYDLLRDDSTFNELKQLLGFYLARQGSYDSFLYADPDDSVAVAQNFGTTTGGALATYQLIRSIGPQSEAVMNVAAGAQLFIDGTPMVLGTDYTISATGLVTTLNAYSAGHALTWSGTYYLRSRFMTDNSPMSFNQFMQKLWENKAVEFYGSFGTKI